MRCCRCSRIVRSNSRRGTRFSYSNSGYAVLGAIVEKVTQQSFAESLHEYVLVPIGARETRYDSAERILPRRARGYECDGTAYRNAPYLDMSQPYAAGALVSTVDDLLTWDTALTSGRILKPESLAQHDGAVSPCGRDDDARTATAGRSPNYADHAVAEHSGGINGFRCHVVRIADANVYVAVLSNDGSAAGKPARLARKIASLLVGAPLTEPPATGLPPSVLDQFAGRYLFPDDRWIRIERDGDHLRMEGPAGDGVLDADSWRPVQGTRRRRAVRVPPRRRRAGQRRRAVRMGGAGGGDSGAVETGQRSFQWTSACARRDRPRLICDLTVPSGSDSRSATSSYDNSPRSRRTTARRQAGGSVWSACLRRSRTSMA